MITAPSVQGIRYGLQTLRQLLPAQGGGRIEGVELHDAPRYPWRGAMLDVGRHTFPVADILRWIDLLERYKLNVFHWHLTEDQGWRIAIDKYPKLTSIGAFRIEADSSRYGGFFTKADVRQVVAYAAARGITVVPEIEMPGHARAAIAAYPELSCTGAPLPVPTTWGVFGDVLCPTVTTFRFLEGVLTEVLELFPSHYIHIGGDEVPKDRWKACTECQAIMRREGLKNEHELQRWFIALIGTRHSERGWSLTGWGEIIAGGMPRGGTAPTGAAGPRAAPGTTPSRAPVGRAASTASRLDAQSWSASSMSTMADSDSRSRSSISTAVGDPVMVSSIQTTGAPCTPSDQATRRKSAVRPEPGGPSRRSLSLIHISEPTRPS